MGTAFSWACGAVGRSWLVLALSPLFFPFYRRRRDSMIDQLVDGCRRRVLSSFCCAGYFWLGKYLSYIYSFLPFFRLFFRIRGTRLRLEVFFSFIRFDTKLPLTFSNPHHSHPHPHLAPLYHLLSDPYHSRPRSFIHHCHCPLPSPYTTARPQNPRPLFFCPCLYILRFDFITMCHFNIPLLIRYSLPACGLLLSPPLLFYSFYFFLYID